jgi:serine/threonine protein kinase
VIETVGRVYIVSEYLPGELYYHIVQQGVLSESRAAKMFKQLAEAIQYIVSC